MTTNGNTPKPHALPDGEGERLWMVGDIMVLKATAASTGGALTLIDNWAPPGGGPPPHVHENEDEFWFVVEGTFDIRLDDEVHTVGPGGFAYAPRGTLHNFKNVSDQPGRVLLGFTPSGIEEFFRDAGGPALNDGPAPAVTPESIAHLLEVAPKCGVAHVNEEHR